MSMPMLRAAVTTETLVTVGVAVMSMVMLLMAVFFFRDGFIWIKALVSGAYVSLFDIIFMELRRISPRLVVDTYIRLTHAGIAVGLVALQKHVLAGGDIKRVADWVVVTRSAGVPIAWEKAATIDLAEKLPDLDEVQRSDREKLFQHIADADIPDG